MARGADALMFRQLVLPRRLPQQPETWWPSRAKQHGTLGAFTTWFNGWALLVGWAAAGIAGTACQIGPLSTHT
jgi:hypothetical protein